MAELGKATLPQRMASKQQFFEERRKALDGAVAELWAAADAGKDEKMIKAATETVHPDTRPWTGSSRPAAPGRALPDFPKGPRRRTGDLPEWRRGSCLSDPARRRKTSRPGCPS